MPLTDIRLEEIVVELTQKPRHEKVRANIYVLLTEGLGAASAQIDFEMRIPEARGRIDALLGRTVLEFKSDLDAERAAAEEELSRYLPERMAATKQHYLGMATDGLDYSVYEYRDAALVRLADFRASPDRPRELLTWLDGTVALGEELPAEALTIQAELGKSSVAYRRSETALSDLWSRIGSRSDVALKRQLWRQLLSLVYGKAVDDDALWFQHTFLVIVAKAVAVRAVDLPLPGPDALLSGDPFESVGIFGAVESDFFDWVLADPAGTELVQRIAKHVERFRLRDVETDVLKVLYESLVDPAQRHDLGEYYTPDWLAAKMCRAAIEDPLDDRVVDPACGSGTFLFHAIRGHLAAADAAGTDPSIRAEQCCRKVAGMDIHPVAVIIARVTCLLALGSALDDRSNNISIPVYLGDALQWNVKQMFLSPELVIEVPPLPGGASKTTLNFPESVCRRTMLFDRVVDQMRDGAADGLSSEGFIAAIKRLDGLGDDELTELGRTYENYDALTKAGRNSIWSYVARNLSRPLYLASEHGRADVVIGNPPWLSFRYMSKEMQSRFRDAANYEKVWVGGKLATHSDLSGLFFAKAQALYLKEGGRIAFVMPLAALSRGQFERFRTGSFRSHYVQFEEAWTFGEEVWPLFPVPSCVLIARKGKGLSKPIPETVTAYSGTLPYRDAPEDAADTRLTVRENAPRPQQATFEGGSEYRGAFRQGATLVPRMLCLVQPVTVGRLGGSAAAPTVESRRTPQEKSPWKELPSLRGQVESEFLRPVYLGESIAPFRTLEPVLAVIPFTEPGGVLDSARATNRGFTHLRRWLVEAERAWDAYKSSTFSFADQVDYFGKLNSQFPVAPIRVVYAKAGTLPAACVLRDDRALVDHKAYWARIDTLHEANYLVSIINSEIARSRVEHLQSRGQWGARDFDKVLFSLLIPRFDTKERVHADLAAAGEEAAKIAAAVEIPEGAKFQHARRLIRNVLKDSGVSDRIDGLVVRLLDVGDN